MKSFRTVFPIQRAAISITHTDRLLLAGSCFTEHIGKKLADGKFQVLINPNGIVYNPVSLARHLAQLLEENDDAGSPLFQHNGLWHSWEHHGSFSRPDHQATVDGIRQAREAAAGFLRQTNRLVLTLGTAEVFSLRETGRVVANCHKAPAGWFEQRRLAVPETQQALARMLEKLKARLPDLEVVLTVSPVRHLRNGFVENQRSKAVLVLACAALCEQFDFVHYFPAYELLLDDLRDYRFYAPDMVHPNGQAVDYIWHYFSEQYFPSQTLALLEQIGKIRAAAAHRPFNPDTPEHRAFGRAQVEKIERLASEHPELDMALEKRYFEEIASV